MSNFYFNYSAITDRKDFNQLKAKGKKGTAFWEENDPTDGEIYLEPSMTQPTPFSEAKKFFDPEAAELESISDVLQQEA